MPRSPNGACSSCGKPVYRSHSSRPEIVCHECRHKNPEAYRRKTPEARASRACAECGEIFQPKPKAQNRPPQQYCSMSCAATGNNRKRGRTIRDGKRATWADMSEEARHRKRQKARARHRNHQVTWDGITDEQILERDRWTCRMDTCIYGSRRINPKRKYPDQRSASIDHILPLSLGGDDTEYNKRAAHLGCNMARGQGKPGEQLPMAFGLDPDVVVEPKWAKKPRRCSICCEPVTGRRCTLHMPVHYLTCQACGCLFAHKKQDRIYCNAKCSSAAHHDRMIQTRPAHLRGLEAKALREAGLGWDEIADRLGYSGAPYAAAAAARAVGKRSPRRMAPYIRAQRIGQRLIA